MEIKVQRDTKVIVALTEREAEVINTILWQCVDLGSCPEANEIATALSEQGISETAVDLTYNEGRDLFEVEA